MVKHQSWNENPGFLLTVHVLSTRPFHVSAWSTMAARPSNVLQPWFNLPLLAAWDSPKTEDPIIVGSGLLYLKNVFFLFLFFFCDHFIASLITSLLERKKRTKESILDWKRDLVYHFYWNKFSSLEISTFVFLLKIWLQCGLLEWPQIISWQLIFLCCQVGLILLKDGLTFMDVEG